MVNYGRPDGLRPSCKKILNHLCLSGDAQDESFPYQASQKELFSERFERAAQRRRPRQGCLRAKALRCCRV